MQDHLLQPHLLAAIGTETHYWFMGNLMSTRTPRFFSALQCVPVSVVIPPQGLHFAFPPVELDDSSVLQPAEDPLGGSTTLWCISHF